MRCDPSSEFLPSGITCKEREEVDAFIKDIEVETWTNNEMVDFAIFGGQPTVSI